MACSASGGSCMGSHQPSIAIVGVGYWGKNLLRTFGRLPGVRVTTLCDLDPDRLGAAATEHPDLHCTDDFAALVASAATESGVAAPPPPPHPGGAWAARQAGKHVWVEKPLALTAAEGRELVDAAARGGRILFVDETFLSHPPVGGIKRIR